MKELYKEIIQYATAVGMLVSGIILTVACFFLNAYEITDSVEWYVSQCLIYAGSTFGMSLFVKYKINQTFKENEKKYNS